jgi:serine/threonine-protein kinase
MKAMAPEPGGRYGTAQEFQLELEAALAEIGTAVRARDIGQWVATRFADTRARIRATVEAEMNKAVDPTPSGKTELRAVSLPKLGITSAHGVSAERPSPRRRWRMGVLLVPVVAVLLLGVLRGRRPSPPPPAPASAASLELPSATPSTTTAPAQPAADNVEIVFTAAPAQARLFFDGEPLAGNPATVVRTKDVAAHSLSASAPGYAAKSMAVALDRDSRLSIELERQTARPSAPRASANGRSASAPSGTTSPGDTKPNCAVPYYFDERGIKKIRDECL